MSEMNKIQALLASGAVQSVARTGVARIAIDGVRLLPFRVALGLLISCIRVNRKDEGGKKDPSRTVARTRRATGTPGCRASRQAKGGLHHG